MGKITLDGMEFFAYHGCFKEEQLIGTRFLVDLTIETNTSTAEQSDYLHDTINYITLYHAVKTEMEQKSHLLEHVSKRIIKSITGQFPAITCLELKLSKLNPPVGGKIGKVSYTTEWTRKL